MLRALLRCFFLGGFQLRCSLPVTRSPDAHLLAQPAQTFAF
jgi:hypothetical protein